MSEIIAVTNVKGGVGKTTTVVNLAAALAERGHHVLAVDLDPQASLAISLGLDVDKTEGTIRRLLDSPFDPFSSPIVSTAEGWDVIPSSVELWDVERELESRPERILQIGVGLEPLLERYDYILIDSPATTGALMSAALAAASRVVIPLTPDYLTFQVARTLFRLIKKIQATANPNLKIAGIFLTMYDIRTRHAREVLTQIRETYADVPFFSAVVHASVKLKDAPAAGQSVIRFAPTCQAANAYRIIAEELVNGIRNGRVPATPAPAAATEPTTPPVREFAFETSVPPVIETRPKVLKLSPTEESQAPTWEAAQTDQAAEGAATPLETLASGRDTIEPMMQADSTANGRHDDEATSGAAPMMTTAEKILESLPPLPPPPDPVPVPGSGTLTPEKEAAVPVFASLATEAAFVPLGFAGNMPRQSSLQFPQINLEAAYVPFSFSAYLHPKPSTRAAEAAQTELDSEEEISVPEEFTTQMFQDTTPLAQGGNGASEVHAGETPMTTANPVTGEDWAQRARVAAEPAEQVNAWAHALALEPLAEDYNRQLYAALENLLQRATKKSVPTLIETAGNLSQLGFRSYAAQTYSHAATLDAGRVELWLGWASVVADPLERLSLLQRAIELQPDNPEVKTAFDLAKEQVRDEAARLVEEGSAQLNAGRMPEAHLVFKRAIELDPWNDRAWLQCARSADNLPSKLSYLKQALEVNPHNAEARDMYRVMSSLVDTTQDERWEKAQRRVPLKYVAILATLVLISVALSTLIIWR